MHVCAFRWSCAISIFASWSFIVSRLAFARIVQLRLMRASKRARVCVCMDTFVLYNQTNVICYVPSVAVLYAAARHKTFIITLAFYCCCSCRTIVDPKTTSTNDNDVCIHYPFSRNIYVAQFSCGRLSPLSALVLFEKWAFSSLTKCMYTTVTEMALLDSISIYVCSPVCLCACVWRLFVYKNIYIYVDTSQYSLIASQPIIQYYYDYLIQMQNTPKVSSIYLFILFLRPFSLIHTKHPIIIMIMILITAFDTDWNVYSFARAKKQHIYIE